MSEALYKSLLLEIVEQMIERTTEPGSYSDKEFDLGWFSGVYSMLKIVDTEVRLAYVDPAEVGLGEFNVDEWFRLGADYWNRK